jgi:CDP-glucose 4,6-dehydratase
MENLDVKRVLYNFKDRKVFITGHTGFKGSWLLKLLDIAGADILGYSLEPKTNPSLFKSIEGKLNLKSIIGDINDFNNLNKEINKFQPEFIFHLAAQIGRASCRERV